MSEGGRVRNCLFAPLNPLGGPFVIEDMSDRWADDLERAIPLASFDVDVDAVTRAGRSSVLALRVRSAVGIVAVLLLLLMLWYTGPP